MYRIEKFNDYRNSKKDPKAENGHGPQSQTRPEPENKIRKPAPIETRFAKMEPRKALPALLYFMMIIATASSTMVTIMKMVDYSEYQAGCGGIKQIEVHGGCFAKDKRNGLFSNFLK